MSIENKIGLLWNCAGALNVDSQASKLLKSHYLNICRKLARNSIQIPKKKFAISQMCPHCSCFWTENEFSLKLKPKHVTNNVKTGKLIEKLNNCKDSDKKGLLTRKQKNRAKWLRKRITKNMEINCKQCKHKSLVKMEMPKNNIIKTKDENNTGTNEDSEMNVEQTNKTPKKKKKTKCKTAGLKIPEVGGTDIKIKHSKKNKIKAQKEKSDADMVSVNSNNSRKGRTPNVKKNATVASPKTSNKIVSKTQQHNSIMQLASLLKTQSSNANNSAQKRLETFLK